MGRDDVRQSVGIFNNRLKKTPPYLRGVRGLSDEHNVANNDFMRSQPKTNPHRSEVNNPNRPPLIPLENIKSSKDYVTLGEAKERAQQWSAQAQELRSREKHSREATQMPHDPSLFQRNQNQATEQAVAAEKGSPRKRAKDASCIGPDPERRYTIPVRPRTQAISPGSLETSQYWNQPQYRSWTERITPENVARPDPFPYYDFDHPGETYEEWETRFNAYENSRRRWRENMYDRLFAQPQHPTSGEEKPEAEDGSSPSLNSLPSPIKKVISDIKTPKRPYQPTVSSDLPETEVNPDISRQDSKGHTSNETLQSLPSLFSVALSSEDHPAIADKPHDIPRFQKPVITSSKKDQACQNPKIPDIVAPADRPIPGSIDDLPPHLLQAIDGERKNVKSENQTQMQDRAYSRPSTKRARLDQPHDFAEVVHRDLARRERKSLRRQTLVKPKASVSLPKPSRSPITCPFFQLLPLELRHLIYRQLLCAKKIFRGGELVEDKRTTVVVSEDPHPAFNLGIDATFFRTCRKMYCEALPILYQENWFGFSEVRMLKTFRTKGLPEKLNTRPAKFQPLFAFTVQLQGRLCLLRNVHLRFDHNPRYSNLRGTHGLNHTPDCPFKEFQDAWAEFLNEERYSNKAGYVAFPMLANLVLDFSAWDLQPNEGLRIRGFVDKFRGEDGLRSLTTVGLAHRPTIEWLKVKLLGRGGKMRVLEKNVLNGSF